MNERLQRLNVIILTVVIAYTIAVQKLIASHAIFGPIADPVLVFLSSIGVYQFILSFIYRLVENVPLLLKIYWGRLYLDGFWSYTYTLEGAANGPGEVYFGVWRFEQNLYETKVVGFGIGNDFIVRSRVRSMTDMINNAGMHEFINIRSDSIASAADYYSRTSLLFEQSRRLVFRYPIRIRGATVVYGGPLNGRVCNNLFIKHDAAKCEDDVLRDLQKAFVKNGRIEADAKLRVHTTGKL